MKTLNITFPVRRFMLKSFTNTVPSMANVEMVNEETIVLVDNKIVAVYKKADFDLAPMRHACLSLKFPETERTSGLITKTINVNASPRNTWRNKACSRTKFRREQPRTHDIFLDYARQIAKDYRKYFPVEYAEQIKRMYVGGHKVHRAYRIKGTPFTGGVINENSALAYHRDEANTENGISCMICLKAGVAGGELILPELKIGFACQDGYILLFDGQKYIHGVTPILKPHTGFGYRYTIVYYNNKGMSLCLPPKLEMEHFVKSTRKALTYER